MAPKAEEQQPLQPSTARSPSPGPATSAWSYAGLKASLAKYGKTGILVYLSLSTCVTAGFYMAIESHVDVRGLLGIKSENSEPGWFESLVTGKGSSLALAMLCSKAMVPIKLPVAAALTPYVHRAIQNFFTSGATKGK